MCKFLPQKWVVWKCRLVDTNYRHNLELREDFSYFVQGRTDVNSRVYWWLNIRCVRSRLQLHCVSILLLFWPLFWREKQRWLAASKSWQTPRQMVMRANTGPGFCRPAVCRKMLLSWPNEKPNWRLLHSSSTQPSLPRSQASAVRLPSANIDPITVSEK